MPEPAFFVGGPYIFHTRLRIRTYVHKMVNGGFRYTVRIPWQHGTAGARRTAASSPQAPETPKEVSTLKAPKPKTPSWTCIRCVVLRPAR